MEEHCRLSHAYLTSGLERNFTVIPLEFKEVFSVIQQ